MFKACVEIVETDKIHKISLLHKNRLLNYSDTVKLWKSHQGFRTFFISLLRETPFAAYFWETPPVSAATFDQPFEFVLVDSSSLAEVVADSDAFNNHFTSPESNKDIVTFPNLGHDALLVAPCPRASPTAYVHLAAFSRYGPEAQQHRLWQTVGQVMENRLGDQPFWASTSGLGVYWLHIRLDSYPKYYSYGPYREHD